MKKSITKSDIIKAITNEPVLRRGYWFASGGKKDCSVCVVGSVIRAISFEKWGRKNKIGLNHLVDTLINTSFITEGYMVEGHFDS